MQIVKYMNSMAVLSRQKLNGLGEHWGVLLPSGMVAHNTAERDVHLLTFEEFRSGQKVTIVREIPQSQWIATNWRLHHELQNRRKYHLTDNNCEIFANRVTGDVPESPQVKGAALLLLAIIFMAALN